MKLNEFLVKNDVVLDIDAFEFCQEGIEMMIESVDPLHNEEHVFSILDNLDRFLAESREIDRNKIDFEVLLISVCWHDAWRSRRFPGYGLSSLWHLFWDGLGSMRLFTKLAKQFGFEKGLIRPVRYAVRKHSRFQFRKTKTIEAKILRDMDSLDFWSLGRIKKAVVVAEKNGWISPPAIRTARLYFRFINLLNRSSFFFEWTRKEAAVRKQAYFDEAGKLLDYYEERYFKKQSL